MMSRPPPPQYTTQTVMVMCGAALSPQIRAASRNVPYFSALQDPLDHSCQDSVIQPAMHTDLQSGRSSSGLEAITRCVKLAAFHWEWSILSETKGKFIVITERVQHRDMKD